MLIISTIHIKLEGAKIKYVNCVQYLGTVFETTGTQESEINSRIEKVNRSLYALITTLLNMQEVSCAANIRRTRQFIDLPRRTDANPGC